MPPSSKDQSLSLDLGAGGTFTIYLLLLALFYFLALFLKATFVARPPLGPHNPGFTAAAHLLPHSTFLPQLAGLLWLAGMTLIYLIPIYPLAGTLILFQRALVFTKTDVTAVNFRGLSRTVPWEQIQAISVVRGGPLLRNPWRAYLLVTLTDGSHWRLLGLTAAHLAEYLARLGHVDLLSNR